MKTKQYKSKNFRQRSRYQDIQVKDASRPIDGENEINTLLSTKAAKGLVKSGSSITVRVDPYTSTLPESDPYALLNRLNRMTGGTYGGDDNLDGGNTRQFMTSETSAFLHNFDSFCLTNKLNYRYLPITTAEVRGKQFTNEMIKAISEVISTANATTFTSLVSNSYQVTSNLPTGTYSQGESGYFVGGDAPGLFQWMIYYQIMLQSIAGVVTTFNKSRGYMGEMMRMSWNRQTPKLNSYFGLLKKKSFLAILDSLCYTIEGEYFDLDWLSQANMLAVLCSRRAEASTEPLIELSISHNLPSTFKLTLSNTEIYNHSYLDQLASTLQLNLPASYAVNSFSSAIQTWNKLLSINDILAWVRNPASNVTELDRFDALIDLANYFVAVMNYFKPAMSDLRTTLDVLSRVRVNQWSKTVRLKIVEDTNAPVYRNLVLESLYKMLGGGSDAMTFNNTTYRWSGHSLWNIYTGVPEYDSKSGGAFLSFSSKSLPTNIATTDPDAIAYLPVAMNLVESITAVNRLGTVTDLQIKRFDPSTNVTTARLIPIPTMNVVMRIVGPVKTDLSTMDMSMLQLACLKVFGGFAKTDGTIGASTDLAIEPDTLCFITYEIEDLSNEMITYARTKGPFVVNVSDKTNLGFLGLVSSKQ